MDLFLGCVRVNYAKLQLVGMMCLSLASKITEIYPVSFDQLIYISDKTYIYSELEAIERVIGKVLNLRLYKTTEYTFFSLISEELKLSEKSHQMALKCMYYALLDIKSRAYLPNEIALGCICYSVSSYEPTLDLTITERDRIINFNVYLGQLIGKYETQPKMSDESFSSDAQKIFMKHMPNK